MLFNSFEYAIFFPFAAAGYFLLPYRFRVLWLLAASCAFYMAYRPVYILVLFTTILIDYLAGIGIGASTGRRARLLLWLSIAATCAVLFVFKYHDFLDGALAAACASIGLPYSPRPMHLLLPIGLSFHTFQSLSYVIEVYLGRQQPERNFLVYATYVMFFPQLVAGPIERPQNLLHQLRQRHQFDNSRAISGLKRIAWGLFKKCVVADRLAIFVNSVFGAPQDHTGAQLSLGAVFFAYQLYCDFSGYSDIAIGSARVLGFRLMENFDSPYHSRSIGEFWRRWHISLSTWFRDYVFIPLGGSKRGHVRTAFNYLVTFAISGLWHGAGWTFLIWGLLNGVMTASGRATRDLRDRILGKGWWRSPISIASTFLLSAGAFVFFRAKTVSDAVYILTHAFVPTDGRLLRTSPMDPYQLPLAFGAILLLEAGELLQSRWRFVEVVAGWPLPVRWCCYLAFVFTVALFGVYESSPFIYFQF